MNDVPAIFFLESYSAIATEVVTLCKDYYYFLNYYYYYIKPKLTNTKQVRGAYLEIYGNNTTKGTERGGNRERNPGINKPYLEKHGTQLQSPFQCHRHHRI